MAIIDRELAAAGQELVECHEKIVFYHDKLRRAQQEIDDLKGILRKVRGYLHIEATPETLQAVRYEARKNIYALVCSACN